MKFNKFLTDRCKVIADVSSNDFFFWQLKLTDGEYKELKNELSKYYKSRGCFSGVVPELLLYLSEWYRREYEENLSARMAFEGLHIDNADSEEGGKTIIQTLSSERDVFTDLRVQIVRGDAQYDQRLFSAFYQGGLPLKYIFKKSQNRGAAQGPMVRFVKGLIEQLRVSDGTNLPMTMERSRSVQKFCEKMVYAALRKRFIDMPFYCQDDQDDIYQFLVGKIGESERERIARNPFDIKWEFKIDWPGRRISPYFHITGPHKLGVDYMKDNGLGRTFDLSAKIGTHITPLLRFVDGGSLRPLQHTHLYDGESVVKLQEDETGKILVSDSLDLSSPIILGGSNDSYSVGCRNDDDSYIILFDNDWRLTINDNLCNGDVFKLLMDKNEREVNVYRMENVDDLGKIRLVNDKSGESKSFARDTSFYSTMVEGGEIDSLYFKPGLYLDNSIRVYKTSKHSRIETRPYFRCKQRDSWTQTPIVGPVYIRAEEDVDTNESVSPIRIINMGTEPRVCVCQGKGAWESIMKIEWDKGQCRPADNKCELNDNGWLIRKDDCDQDSYIRWNFTPDNGKTFELDVFCPFIGFYVYDQNGKLVRPRQIEGSLADCYIPLVDYGYYTYQTGFSPVWVGESRIAPNTQGRLYSICKSVDDIESEFERKCQLDEFNPFRIETECGDEKYVYCVKKSPYMFGVNEDKINVCVKDRDNVTVRIISDFYGRVKIVVLDDLEVYDARTLGNGEYQIPKEIIEGNEQSPDNSYPILVYAVVEGRVAPTIIDLKNPDQRWNMQDHDNRNYVGRLTNANYENPVWSRCLWWFEHLFETVDNVKISLTKIPEFDRISRNQYAVIKLIFYLFCKKRMNQDSFDNMVNSLPSELLFQWWWIPQGNIDEAIDEMLNISNEEVLYDDIIEWAGSKSMDYWNEVRKNPGLYVSEYIVGIKDSFAEFYKSILSKDEYYSMNERRLEVEGYDSRRRYDIDSLGINSDFWQYNLYGRLKADRNPFLRRVALLKYFIENPEKDIFERNPRVKCALIYCIKKNPAAIKSLMNDNGVIAGIE